MGLTIRCRLCGRREDVSDAQLAEKLRELGFLRRQAEPSVELSHELAQTAIEAGRWGACPQCGNIGFGATPAVDEADDAELWGDARLCETCRAVIPQERLEVFPNSTKCARCQRQSEGAESAEREFCPRCGNVLQLKAATTPGATYRLHCSVCRKSF